MTLKSIKVMHGLFPKKRKLVGIYTYKPELLVLLPASAGLIIVSGRGRAWVDGVPFFSYHRDLFVEQN